MPNCNQTGKPSTNINPRAKLKESSPDDQAPPEIPIGWSFRVSGVTLGIRLCERCAFSALVRTGSWRIRQCLVSHRSFQLRAGTHTYSFKKPTPRKISGSGQSFTLRPLLLRTPVPKGKTPEFAGVVPLAGGSGKLGESALSVRTERRGVKFCARRGPSGRPGGIGMRSHLYQITHQSPFTAHSDPGS